MPVFDKFKALKTPDWAALVTGEGGALEVRLYGVIGETWYGDGTSARRLCDDIAAADPSELTVRINSPGGSATDGLTIYNYLRGLRAQGVPVITVIDGMAASIASVIALAGTQVRMNRAAFFHIHEPFSFVEGRAEEMRAAADDLDKVTATLAGVYAEKTGKPVEEIRDLMRGRPGFDGTLFTSSEALVGGFVDEIDSEAVKLPAAAFSLELFNLDTPTTAPGTSDPSDQSNPSDKVVPTETEPVTTASEPVNTASEPVNTASEPVNTASEPVNTASEPVPTDPAPVPTDPGEPTAADELKVMAAELAAAKSQLAVLQSRVMGPATAPGPKYSTWREAVAALGYPEAKKQCPHLYREAVSK